MRTVSNPSGNTSGQHSFARIPSANIMRSSFDRSCGRKSTFDSGYLVPIFVDEVLPGDTFNLSYSAFARLATPLKPFMDNLFMDFFWFYVPNRLLWNNWEKMNGAQANPDDSTDFLVPIMAAPASTGYLVESLSDYLGIPTGVPLLEHVSLWHRAYNLIYNEWYRDQNLQDSVVVDLDDGPDDPADYVLLRRGKRHDYFTSCLPFPQKGPAVDLPLGTSAPIVATVVPHATNDPTWSAGSTPTVFSLQIPSSGSQTIQASSGPTGGSFPDSLDWANPALALAGAGGTGTPFADLTSATAATIAQLREAFQIQRMFERDARGGTRYTEILRSHFGVISPDARLQRPEFLGSSTVPVNVNPVANTTYDLSGENVTGDLAAFVTASAQGHGFVKSFTEHGVLIGLVNVRADLTYQQGLNRMFSRRTRFDFYWPSFAHLSEQAVLNKEIFADGSAADDDVFGYQERYAEYRYKPSEITGQFRSTYATPLDVWHLAQEFSVLPALNASFIVDVPPIDRVLAVSGEIAPQFIFDCYVRLNCVRPMPVFGVPGLIDHF